MKVHHRGRSRKRTVLRRENREEFTVYTNLMQTNNALNNKASLMGVVTVATQPPVKCRHRRHVTDSRQVQGLIFEVIKMVI